MAIERARLRTEATPSRGAAPRRGVLSGWGRVPLASGDEVRSENLERLTHGATLTRGLGRSYGDSSLPAVPGARVVGTALADRILAFHAETRVLRAEAGLSLDELYRVFLPQGYFTPVTPGTRFVTLGGMVASDVHGKNHHRAGCFGEHVVSLKLRVGDGRLITCSPVLNADLFKATIGGMGLTGHIVEVAVRLEKVPSPWIYQETQRIDNIDQFIEALKAAASKWPMTMGWIDCLSRGGSMGRGLLYCGRWAQPHEAPSRLPRLGRPIPIPFMMPNWLLGRATVRAFNAVYYRQQRARVAHTVVDPQTFLYPLDFLGDWHRLYGTRGFTQYQCVLPNAADHGPARRFMDTVTRRGGASFLCVIKDCGAEGVGMLSFPKSGVSIALDLPMRDDTQALVDALNELVIAEGGRIYLTKDALTRAHHFRAMEPRLDEFLRVRRRWDPEGRISSAQSVRLFGW